MTSPTAATRPDRTPDDRPQPPPGGASALALPAWVTSDPLYTDNRFPVYLTGADYDTMQALTCRFWRPAPWHHAEMLADAAESRAQAA